MSREAMTIDKKALKALAEAANAVTSDVNITMAVGTDPAEVKAVQDYLQVAMPKTILDLLAEIDGAHAQHARDSAELRRLCQARDDARKERDQLKAENEALRKAMSEISGQVDGNIRCAVRDVVNCRGDVQDIYDYCDTIDEIIDAAMAKEAIQ